MEARRYLEHAIAPETPLSGAVRLRMHGQIRLGGWLPFRAEQVIVWRRGFIWKAAVRMLGLPIRGADRLVDGRGAMRWKMLGLLPVMSEGGDDISRSSAGRMAAESIWLPSVLCRDEVSWSVGEDTGLRAELEAGGRPAALELTCGGDGRLLRICTERWGNPDGEGFRVHPFGAVVEEERSFDGYTVPGRLRVGWYLGSERFEREGEFFRAEVEAAEYR
jgi:hypothetical protein